MKRIIHYLPIIVEIKLIVAKEVCFPVVIQITRKRCANRVGQATPKLTYDSWVGPTEK